MDKNTAAQYLPFVRALIDGKTLQVFNPRSNEWKDIADPIFRFAPSSYRIKPKSRTPHQIYMDAAYPEWAPSDPLATTAMEAGYRAIIDAVKSGELK